MSKTQSIPTNWSIQKLSKLVDIQPGFGFDSKKFCEKGIRVVKISNISFKQIIWDVVSYLPQEYGKKYKEYLLKPNDIVMAITRPVITGGIKIARVKHSDCPCLLNQRNCRFIPKEYSNINYLYQFFFSHYFIRRVQMFASGTEQPNISTYDLNKIRILLPPSIEQQKIVTILENVDNIIQIIQRIIDNLRIYKKGLMQRLFTQGIGNKEFKDSKMGKIPESWEMKKLQDILKLEYGKGLAKDKREIGDYPVLGSNGIIDYHKEYLIDGPGIIVGRKGSMGKVTWIEENFWPIDTTYYVEINEDDISFKWLYYCLIQLRLDRLKLHDVVPGLNREYAYSKSILIPPIKEQKQILNILNNIDLRIEIENMIKNKTKLIKKGLMQNLLTGKKRVKIQSKII